MQTIQATLLERVGHLYRRLLILQQLFPVPREPEDIAWLRTGDSVRDLALCAALREVLDELTDHARVLTSVPSPLSEWRQGDGPEDERWRALTAVERREILGLATSYEELITWAEGLMLRGVAHVGIGESYVGTAVVQPGTNAPSVQADAREYLQAERARVARFRQDMAFLYRRRMAAVAGSTRS